MASMRKVATKITYLEMLRPCAATPRPPVADVSIDRLAAPSVAEYRLLYSSVGKEYHWVDRLLMPDEQLHAILQDDAVEIYLLRVGGEPAGYCELDRRTAEQIELAYFGLLPAFRGYRVMAGEKELGTGNVATGWAALGGDDAGAFAAVRDYHQQYPKATEVAPGRIVLRLWPKYTESFGGLHLAWSKGGTVDPKTLAPAGCHPFAGAGEFVKAMWQAYRPKADEIGTTGRNER